MYHEIVNDNIADTPVLVIFCPLCNTSIVFERTVGESIDARVLDFDTTGRLRNSDLVMYDRQTESWWQQFTGVGIIGTYTDVELVRLPSQIVSFEQFKMQFAEGNVLSRDTGYSRPYGNNPYRGYDAIDNNPLLFDGVIDPRLPAMERVLSVNIGENTQLIALRVGDRIVSQILDHTRPPIRRLRLFSLARSLLMTMKIGVAVRNGAFELVSWN